MANQTFYGVDLGGKKIWVSDGNDLGVPHSIDEFLSFSWAKGPGHLLTENTSLYARPLYRVPSLAQYLTFAQVQEFLRKCKEHGIEPHIYPNKSTYKAVRTFMEKVKAGHPSVAKFSHIDFSSFKPDAKGKFKDDNLEAMVLAWIMENAPYTTSRLKSVRDPDKEWDRIHQIKHEVVENSNRRLNQQRIMNGYDDPDFSRLRDLLPAIEQEVLTSNHPGAEVLRNIEAFPLPRAHRDSDKWGYKKGDIKLHELTPALKAVWSCRVSEYGGLYKFGFQMLKRVLGFSAFRFKSCVAGAQLHFDVHKEIRRFRLAEAGLTELKGNDSYDMLTRDETSPYYGVRIQSHRDLKNVVKFLNLTYEKLL